MPRRRATRGGKRKSASRKAAPQKMALSQAARDVLLAQQQQQIQQNNLINAALQFHERRVLEEKFRQEHPDMADILKSSETAQQLFEKIMQDKLPAVGSPWNMYSPQAQRAVSLHPILGKDVPKPADAATSKTAPKVAAKPAAAAAEVKAKVAAKQAADKVEEKRTTVALQPAREYITKPLKFKYPKGKKGPLQAMFPIVCGEIELDEKEGEYYCRQAMNDGFNVLDDYELFRMPDGWNPRDAPNRGQQAKFSEIFATLKLEDGKPYSVPKALMEEGWSYDKLDKAIQRDGRHYVMPKTTSGIKLENYKVACDKDGRVPKSTLYGEHCYVDTEGLNRRIVLERLAEKGLILENSSGKKYIYGPVLGAGVESSDDEDEYFDPFHPQ